ncbi:MAG: hypothetical protein IJ242_08190 [Clostridia bacterium]|nr:hypothetical protein [Clostridia bacterium]
MNQENTNFQSPVISSILDFLHLFLPIAFAKRIIAAILLFAGTKLTDIASLLGMGLSTVYNFRKTLSGASSKEENYMPVSNEARLWQKSEIFLLIKPYTV